MDLMSSLRSLLLCALATLLPGALGISSAQLQEIKWNNSMTINQKQLTHKILLNLNGPPLVKVVSELQSVFKDIACRNCTTCMERAIKAHKTQSHIISNQPNLNELYYDVLRNNERNKRNTEEPNDSDKNIGNTSVTAKVTRYVKDKKVFAIEINESNEKGKSNICSIYSVKKSVLCGSSSTILSTVKKVAKRHKKTKAVLTQVIVTTQKSKPVPFAFKKRQVDSSQVPETFSPSIEDMY